MNDLPPDSGSVRPPTTGEGQYSPRGAVGAVTPRPARGSNWSIFVVVAVAVAVIVAGGAAIVVSSGGDSTDDLTPVASSVAPTTQVAVQETLPAPAETATPQPATSAQATASEPTAPETTVPPTVVPAPPAPTPAQVGQPTIAASIVRPGGQDSCTPPNDTSYDPALAYDSSVDTAWMAPGDGVGQRLVFTFPSSVTVSQVGLFPGYGKFDPCTSDDRFFQLRRIGSVQWSFDDGSAVDQDFTSAKTTQLMDIAPRATRTVTITIVTTVEPGVARLDHTPISEVVIG